MIDSLAQRAWQILVHIRIKSHSFQRKTTHSVTWVVSTFFRTGQPTTHAVTNVDMPTDTWWRRVTVTLFKSLSTTVSTAAILHIRLASLVSIVMAAPCCPVFQGHFGIIGYLLECVYINHPICSELTSTSLTLAWAYQQCSSVHHVHMADTALLRKGKRPMNAHYVLPGSMQILVSLLFLPSTTLAGECLDLFQLYRGGDFYLTVYTLSSGKVCWWTGQSDMSLYHSSELQPWIQNSSWSRVRNLLLEQHRLLSRDNSILWSMVTKEDKPRLGDKPYIVIHFCTSPICSYVYTYAWRVRHTRYYIQLCTIYYYYILLLYIIYVLSAIHTFKISP